MSVMFLRWAVSCPNIFLHGTMDDVYAFGNFLLQFHEASFFKAGHFPNVPGTTDEFYASRSYLS